MVALRAARPDQPSCNLRSPPGGQPPKGQQKPPGEGQRLQGLDWTASLGASLGLWQGGKRQGTGHFKGVSHFQIHAPQQNLLGPDFHRPDRTSLRLAHLFDDLVGNGEQRWRNFQAQCLRRLPVYHYSGFRPN